MAAKDPSCRTQDWCRRGGEVGAFLDRVKELFDFLTSATELPSFEELFKVHCGGSLEQIYSFCVNQVKIEAVVCKGTRHLSGVVVVRVRPVLDFPAAQWAGCLKVEKINKWVEFQFKTNPKLKPM